MSGSQICCLVLLMNVKQFFASVQLIESWHSCMSLNFFVALDENVISVLEFTFTNFVYLVWRLSRQ